MNESTRVTSTPQLAADLAALDTARNAEVLALNAARTFFQEKTSIIKEANDKIDALGTSAMAGIKRENLVDEVNEQKGQVSQKIAEWKRQMNEACQRRCFLIERTWEGTGKDRMERARYSLQTWKSISEENYKMEQKILASRDGGS